MLLSTLHLTPEPHSSSCIIHACSEWMKGMLLWASRSRSPQSFFELRRGEEKGLWCSFYIRWQSDGNFFFNERGDKSFDRHYFINAHWPQRGAAAPQHMQNVPQFSRQHMYGCICLSVMCDINVSEGYFHRALGEGALMGITWKWQCESWGEQERGVLLNLTSAPGVALISPQNATCCWRWWWRQLTSANWQSQPYRLNNALSHTSLSSGEWQDQI